MPTCPRLSKRHLLRIRAATDSVASKWRQCVWKLDEAFAAVNRCSLLITINNDCTEQHHGSACSQIKLRTECMCQTVFTECVYIYIYTYIYILLERRRAIAARFECAPGLCCCSLAHDRPREMVIESRRSVHTENDFQLSTGFLVPPDWLFHTLISSMLGPCATGSFWKVWPFGVLGPLHVIEAL